MKLLHVYAILTLKSNPNKIYNKSICFLLNNMHTIFLYFFTINFDLSLSLSQSLLKIALSFPLLQNCNTYAISIKIKIYNVVTIN